MKRDTMQRLYLRTEPTVDSVALKHSPTLAKRARDVVAYADEAATEFKGRWPWHYTQSKPKEGCDTVTLNCYIYRAVWLPEKER